MSDISSEKHAAKDVLLLCGSYRNMAATVEDHLNAFERYSKNRYFRLQTRGGLPKELDLSRFDALVIHYTIIASYDGTFYPQSRARIREFNGLKAMFIQDEYRFVNRTIAAIQEMDINLLFTCVPLPEIGNVYPQVKLPHVRKVNVLTGFVPGYLLGKKVPRFTERTIDVGYRGRTLPAWLGELGQEKWQIGHRFERDAKAYGLRCDIAYREEDRIYGGDWIHFLMNCKAVLGVESGASVVDFTGDVQRQVEEHELRYPSCSFDELRNLYFKDLQGRIRFNQISPRSFECAALRTLMILYEGEYSGILKAWRHYLPLKKDHSNMAEIVSALRDPHLCEEIIANTYTEIAENPHFSYESFVEKVDLEMNRTFRPEMARGGSAYTAEEFSVVPHEQIMCLSPPTTLNRIHLFLYVHIFCILLFWVPPSMRSRLFLHLRKYYYSTGVDRSVYWVSKLLGKNRIIRD